MPIWRLTSGDSRCEEGYALLQQVRRGSPVLSARPDIVEDMDLTALVLLFVGLAIGSAVGRSLGRSATRTRDAAAARAAERELASVRATLEAEQAAAAERLAALRDEQERMSEQFQALAAQALLHNNEAFLALADERLKASQQVQAGELAKKAAEMQQLVQPIQETLGKVAQSIVDTDKARVASHATLMESVRLSTVTAQQLQSETHTLVRALSAPQARGAWGEMQLRRVVEIAGMLEHCDFETQVSTTSVDGVTRPDLVVNLAGGKQIVVDAKVSLAAFLDAAESDDAEVHARRLTAHARHLKTHVDSLAGKAYWKQFSTAPDFVVLFVPGESFLVHALAQDPGLPGLRDGATGHHRDAVHAHQPAPDRGLLLEAGGAGRQRPGDLRAGPRAL